MTNFSKVGIFMKTFGQEVKVKASFSTEEINQLRISLLKEELNEKILLCCIYSIIFSMY